MLIHEVSVEAIAEEIFQMPIEGPQNPGAPVDEPVLEPVRPNAQDLGGDRYDLSGNLIKNNMIIKTADEVKGLSKPKEDSAGKIEGEGDKPKPEEKDEEVEMKVDATGNLVDKDGKVVKNAGDFEIDAEGNVSFKESPFVQSIADAYRTKGYELKGEDGNALSFEDTDEGYQALTGAIAIEEANSYIREYIENNAEVVGLANYLRAGLGNATDYYKSKVSAVDYTTLSNVTEEADQETLVVDHLMKMNNMKEDDAKDIVKMYKAAGTLGDKAKNALTSLQEWQKTNVANEQKVVNDALAAEQAAEVKRVDDIKKVVMAGKLGNFEIPVTERQKFADFLVKPVEGGVSEATKQYDELRLDQKLMLEYMYYTKFDVDSLVKIKLNQAKADLFTERANRASKIVIKENLQRQTGNSGNIPDPENVS